MKGKASPSGKAAPSAAGGLTSPRANKASAANAAVQKRQQQQEPKRASKSDMLVMASFVLVAVIAFVAGKYPTQTTGVFQNTKGLVASMLGRSLEQKQQQQQQQQAAATVTTTTTKQQQQQKKKEKEEEAEPKKKAFKLGVKVDPHPTQSITTPTATLRAARQLTAEEIKAQPFRPVVLTDSVTPGVTPAHGANQLGLFLYPNGFSKGAVNVAVARSDLCRSASAMADALTKLVPEDTFRCAERGGCRLFLHNGWEVTSCDELVDDDMLWLVPKGREFMWPTFRKGHKVAVQHVPTMNQEPIVVETLSESPKLFRLHNFFTPEEADELVDHTLGMTDPIHGLHRSTTGQGSAAAEDSHRTSENAWDLVSPASMRLKQRIFDLLGIRPFQNGWADGLQVLRYNTTKAYNSHYDYLEYRPGGRLDSAKPGGVNRFATVVIYLSDVEEGGETVFPQGKALDGSDKGYADVLTELSGKGIELEALGIKRGSWEENLVVQCRSKLATKPKKAEAVLFYDQMPMGGQDNAALHGGCPVLKGTKWAANLWVWNGNVHGDDLAPAGKGGKQAPESQIQAEFVSRLPGHSLYWQDTFFAPLEQEMPVRMNTFEGHTFHIHQGRDEASKGARVATFVIGPDNGRLQTFEFPDKTAKRAATAPVHEEEEDEAESSDEEGWGMDDEEEEEEYVYEDEDE